MKIVVLGSGSRGNATLISSGKTNLLVDLGFGTRSLLSRLHKVGLQETRIDAVLLSHGHIDHFRGILSLCRRRKIPLYLSEGTLQEIPELANLKRRECFGAGAAFTVGDLDIETFPVPHDAAEPVGFRIRCGGMWGAVVTDLGYISNPVQRGLLNCDWIVLESNHDEEMLRVGPYPWHLKERLMSDLGHLSNEALGRFLSGPFDGRARHIFLAHLSQTNNDPEIALFQARQALKRRSNGASGDVNIHLTHQHKPSIVLSL